MQYTEKELSQLISDVEKEFAGVLAKSEEANSAALVKAEDKPEEKKEEKPEEKKPEHKEEHKEEEHKEEPKAESKEDAHAEPKHEEKHAEEKHEHQAEDGCDYDEQDMDHMHNMYRSMKKGELKAHHDSVKKALDHHGMAKCGDMAMAKSETDTAVVITPEVIKEDKEMELLKSEVEAQKAKNDSLQKNLDAVQAFLTKLVEVKAAPKAKAITSLEAITKSEGAQEEKTLTKNEVDAILLKKSADYKLAKSDRELINAFYLNGTSINTITHLLK